MLVQRVIYHEWLLRHFSFRAPLSATTHRYRWLRRNCCLRAHRIQSRHVETRDNRALVRLRRSGASYLHHQGESGCYEGISNLNILDGEKPGLSEIRVTCRITKLFWKESYARRHSSGIRIVGVYTNEQIPRIFAFQGTRNLLRSSQTSVTRRTGTTRCYACRRIVDGEEQLPEILKSIIGGWR